MFNRPILVIDDDPALLETVSTILEDEGYAVEQAMNGVEGLKVIERIQPTLIVLDMRMPVMDGWGFSKVLRERGLRFPILVMTAAQDAQRWAQEIEADGFLAKPFELNDLIDAIARYRTKS